MSVCLYVCIWSQEHGPNSIAIPWGNLRVKNPKLYMYPPVVFVMFETLAHLGQPGPGAVSIEVSKLITVIASHVLHVTPVLVSGLLASRFSTFARSQTWPLSSVLVWPHEMALLTRNNNKIKQNDAGLKTGLLQLLQRILHWETFTKSSDFNIHGLRSNFATETI